MPPKNVLTDIHETSVALGYEQWGDSARRLFKMVKIPQHKNKQQQVAQQLISVLEQEQGIAARQEDGLAARQEQGIVARQEQGVVARQEDGLDAQRVWLDYGSKSVTGFYIITDDPTKAPVLQARQKPCYFLDKKYSQPVAEGSKEKKVEASRKNLFADIETTIDTHNRLTDAEIAEKWRTFQESCAYEIHSVTDKMFFGTDKQRLEQLTLA